MRNDGRVAALSKITHPNGLWVRRDPRAPNFGWRIAASHPMITGSASVELLDTASVLAQTSDQGVPLYGNKARQVLDPPPRFGVSRPGALASIFAPASSACANRRLLR